MRPDRRARPAVTPLEGRGAPSLVLAPPILPPAPPAVPLAPAGFASGLASDISGAGGAPEMLGD